MASTSSEALHNHHDNNNNKWQHLLAANGYCFKCFIGINSLILCLQQLQEVGTITIPIIQVRKLRPEMKQLAQFHTAGRGQSPNSNPGPKPHHLLSPCCGQCLSNHSMLASARRASALLCFIAEAQTG